MFTEAELAYLAAQPLGRLATQQPNGTLQVNPVAFHYNPDEKTIDITGYNLRKSKKFRNIATHDKVAFVVDDVPSTNPWRVRCLEIRGRAEALTGANVPDGHLDDAVIRIHPGRILAMGVEDGDQDRDPLELEPNFRDV
ncbi:PPOX class F420-dependent oxidoreductase [Amycolatopsis vastitatis]|uniref:Pyridoxamine 5'-phosphate oxidase n=1 Tax=Amycolatopsis vastitatis TaxID=1905142 RepID=A0A229T2R2_9PSEU|nr:PPOX class F420-dependent oxidoreductase [Amycolatopsis vastitatis]OXM65231.1 pyridoxamine 5'-phosphate oxidase [Amycolatopsis vastitatis]